MRQKENREIRGSVLATRNISAGGHIRAGGDGYIGHNLRVDGYLEAANLKDTCKGLYREVEALKEAYPRPKAGWWALVGDSVPAEVYVSVKGTWTATGELSGEPQVDAGSWFAELPALKAVCQEILETLDGAVLDEIKEAIEETANLVRCLGEYQRKTREEVLSAIGLVKDDTKRIREELRWLMGKDGCPCLNSGNTKPTEPTDPDKPDNPDNPEQPDKKNTFAVVLVSGDECAYADITGSKNTIKDAVKQKSYTVDCTPKEYLWICLPEEVEVEGFKSSGFELPVEAPVLCASNDKKLPQFRCWRTSGRPQSAQIKIEIV